MAIVLGIDAAWTAHGSSAVALLHTGSQARRIIAVAPSYTSFVGLADGRPVDWSRASKGPLDVGQLLNAAVRLAGSPVDVVAIDMPMSRASITGYREAERKLSSAFGAFQVSTHTPNQERPGAHGRRITSDFSGAGFRLATALTPMPLSLVEVFPLAALLRLMGLSKRPAYKANKTTKYWPGRSQSERLHLLIESWRAIAAALHTEVGGLGFSLPTVSVSFASLKPYEDALDAVVCAWVGSCFLEGGAEPFGDDTAAIWVPTYFGPSMKSSAPKRETVICPL